MTDPLVLASASPARAEMLRAAGVEIEILPARIDEEEIRLAFRAEGASARDLADALAELKAKKISAKRPGALVLGADQTLAAGEDQFDKPRDRAEARAQLLTLRGRTHHLHSAAVIALDGKPIFCSETCALDIIGAKFVRDVENGEVIICEIQPDGSITIDARKPSKPQPERLCLFEYVYFARPDSVVGGRNVYTTRKNMGMNLAKEAPLEADVVVPVPDGGTPAALGFAQESGIPFEYGIIRNHYVGRTFIEPTQQIRAFGVKLKHSANRAMIEGKRVVLVDDSIVRGTTSVKIVQMIREAGAKEVHIRVASPMIFHPDFYGIDTPDADKLLANQYADVEAMAKYIGADSLAFLSIDGLYRAVGGENRNPARPQFTDHYFTGDYPTRLLDKNGEAMGSKISMLASNG